ncbi:unnamed protein product [Phyllotreta striolata]|uniref:Autism susceptibility gene 2 protein n=1 Tax=Phyllotreta striolata TaxID=444603 RepID=A0A9N9TGT1_PHYSR|nr:unnamed protein product [Phyllotreta striolata]
MDVEVKQRNRRRKRAQRMQAQREFNKADHLDGDSGDEDVVQAKPPRPPNRRKKSKEPLCEEDIIEGFSILQFRSYEDLELVLKIAVKENIKRLTDVERPKIEPKAHITNHILVQHNHGLTLTQDPATSDDSGRASERLTGSSVAPRDADSSRDRLSDASSRCSSGKGYICDSEGEDDKGSDASSVIFASTPASRKHEFPGALPPGLPSLNHGTSGSPVPAPTPPNLPVPSPAPAQQPPQHPPQAIASASVSSGAGVLTPPPPVASGKSSKDPLPPPSCPLPSVATQQPPGVPTAVSMPQPAAAAPVAHHPSLPPALDSTDIVPGGRAMRTESPAVATSANAAVAPSPGHYHHPAASYQHHQQSTLYAPYATTVVATAPSHTASFMSMPMTTAVATAASLNAAPPPQMAAPVVGKASVPAQHHDRDNKLMAAAQRGPSPLRDNRERESYSNVSSLSRTSVATTTTPTPVCPPPTTAVSSSLATNNPSKPWTSNASQPPASAASAVVAASPTQLSPAPPRPTPPLHSSFPSAPIFAAPPPLPPPVSRASPMAVPPANPNPFSAESLFQTNKYPSNQADMLRRELDSRFLASQDRSLGVAPPPYLRTEMHQHQHHHTHVHQHTTSLLPSPAASSLYPSQLSLTPVEPLARRRESSFKDIPKLGSVDSPFYRQNLGLPGTYPGYTPGLMHPGLASGPTPFVPPNHLPTFQPKSMAPQDPTKPKIVKTGKWNAMHVRVAWEIYHHQQKSGEAKGTLASATAAVAAAAAAKSSSDLLRPPTHLFSSRPPPPPPHELSPYPMSLGGHRPPPGFDQPHHPGSLFTTPGGHLAKSPFSAASTLSPFARYGPGPLGSSATSPFSMSPFARDAGHLAALHHDPWRSLRFPPAVNPLPPSMPGLGSGGAPPPWSLKPDPVLEQREREAREREERERERLRREREERERREREEKQRRLEQQQQEQRERERKEREKREMERRELERQRERERERLLQEQRLAESAKMQPTLLRERSPLRNGDMSDIRIKEEPRIKEEDMMARSDQSYYRYNPFLRHPGALQPPGPPASVLDRSRMMQHGLPPHPYHAPTTHWGAAPPPPPSDPFYRYGYNPIVDAMRAQEERDRASFFGAYAASHHASQLRPKDPALMNLRPGPGPPPPMNPHKMSATPPADLHKKEEPR